MITQSEKRTSLILFMLLMIGIVFLSKAYFIRFKETLASDQVFRTVCASCDQDDSIAVKNVFLDFWQPDRSFLEGYAPKGFTSLGYEEVNNVNGLKVKRQSADFLINMNDSERILYSKDAQAIWFISKTATLQRKYYALPEIYNVESEKEAKEIIEIVAGLSVMFRNYLSSIDAKARVFYLRNGNILLVNRFGNLKEFDEEGFIYQMGKGQIYDLYSNGRYFPITKRGE